MVWQPAPGGGAAQGDDSGVRVGTVRSSMSSNPLLAKAELGKV